MCCRITQGTPLSPLHRPRWHISVAVTYLRFARSQPALASTCARRVGSICTMYTQSFVVSTTRQGPIHLMRNLLLAIGVATRTNSSSWNCGFFLSRALPFPAVLLATPITNVRRLEPALLHHGCYTFIGSAYLFRPREIIIHRGLLRSGQLSERHGVQWCLYTARERVG